MKILTFADTHSDMDAIERLARLAKSENVDAMVCAGDISEFGENMRGIFETLDIGIPLIYIAGNHEEMSGALASDFGYVKDINKAPLVLNGVLFLGCAGGGLSRFFTIFERKVAGFREAISKHSGPVILVTHGPPYKTRLDIMGRMDVGAEPIRKFIESDQPNYAISGHIHENSGKQDKIIGTVLVNPGKKGVIINL